MTERAAALRPGYQLGRYQLLMPLAKGGMGQVWAARLTGTRGFQKLVAIKTILPSDGDLDQLELMLFEEASLTSRIRHPNVAETLDLGEQDGTLYLVMEWVNGESLDYILRAARPQGGLPIPIGVHLLEQACRGLHTAHEARDENGEPLKIVHRDVSPQNLLVTYTGSLKLIDFGVAKATQKLSAATEIGHVKGKFAYMSPEQIQEEPLDARADVFAMGIVLYKTTTGVHPYKGDNPAATVRNVLLTVPQRPSEIVPGYPTPLEQVVMKALSLDRSQRFSTAEEMGMALDRSLPPVIRANGQKSTEAFLRKLFDQRIGERSQALAAALRAADVGRSISDPKFVLSGSSRSQSTMRGVSMDQEGPEVVVTGAPEQGVAPQEADRPRPQRRRMAATGLAIAAGLATYLVSRPHVPHDWFSANAARPSADADRAPPIATPPPVESAASITAPRGSPVARDKAPDEPTPKDAKEAAHPPAAPTTAALRAAAKKRDKSHRSDARDGGRSSVPTSAPAPVTPPSQPAEAPSATPDPAPVEESDPLPRQK